MASSTPSSLSRYRPAILILTGAAAAFAAYLVYNTAQSAPVDGLHRSNAVRRPRRARPRSPSSSSTRRIIERLLRDAPPLGELEFFGRPVALDSRTIVPSAALREMAHQAEPAATPEIVEQRIGEFYDVYLDRLLALIVDGISSPIHIDAVTRWYGHQLPDEAIVARALERHHQSALATDEAESIAPTDLPNLSEESYEDTAGRDMGMGMDPEGQTLQRTLYHIAEDRARHEGIIHRGITCNACGSKPIRGIRWHCANCLDFDLCSDCESTNSHIKTHIFYKIRVPAPYWGIPKQEPVYPGRPHLMSPSINSVIKKRLVLETNMEAEEIEALWDQFTCLAATEWNADPNGIGWAMERRAFNQAVIPRYTSFMSAPNLVYDRVFAYFDSNHDGLIGFEEFIKGLDGLHSTDMRVKLRIVFNGYDADGDGYISRKDILRIFRAHYAIEQEAIRNYLGESAEELSVRGALEVIQSSQPLGSAFVQTPIPPGQRENRRLSGKEPNGEHQEPVDDDSPDTLERDEAIRSVYYNNHYDVRRNRSADDAVRDRWARRQFYTDEEEGLERPEGAEDGPSPVAMEGHTDENAEVPPTPENERPRGSRSSSRVRFQDDIDMETRSNASTSSRPIGERWGGYEIPEPEKDLGKDVLYQYTQQAFNELLDPLFRQKEDNAMDAFATRAERRARAAEIDTALEEFKREKDLNRVALALGSFPYAALLLEALRKGDINELLQDMSKNSKLSREDVAKRTISLISIAERDVVKGFTNWDDDWEPNDLALWHAKLYRLQIQQELISAIYSLGTTQTGWLSPELHSEAASVIAHSPSEYKDPTMPQFRPNSQAELESRQIESSSDVGISPTETSSFGEDAFFNFQEFPSLEPIFVVAGGSVRKSPQHKGGPEHGPLDVAQREPMVDVIISPVDSPGLVLGESVVMNKPTLHWLFVDPVTKTLVVERRAGRHYEFSGSETDPVRAFEYLIRRESKQVTSPLHLPFLASLEIVEREIKERKGSGLLNFEEFEELAKGGQLRFLESWMDWVSF